MDSFADTLIAVIIAMVPLSVIAGALLLSRRSNRARNRRNPLTKALLRSPGASLRKELEATQDEALNIMLLVSMLAFGWAGYYLGNHAVGGQFGLSFWVLTGAVFVIAIAYSVRRTLMLYRRISSLRLGLDGELAVGEELNQLMSRGYRIFHDIPGPNYNVDHVVVGPNGVFAVETKCHAKPDGEYTAKFDGTAIRYPDWVDTNATKQAIRQAGAVSKYLSKACGRRINVKAVVILPGWNLEQTSCTKECVALTTGHIPSWFGRLNGGTLADNEIKAIAHQIEQLCRSESPTRLSDNDDVRFSPQLTL